MCDPWGSGPRHVQERDIPYESSGWDTFVSPYADGSTALLFRAGRTKLL